MADNLYQPGDLVPLEATFRNAAGTPTNPTSVTLTIRSPSGTVSTPTATNTGPGVYHYDYALASNAEPGVWDYSFAGSGAVAEAGQDTFVVQPLRTNVGGLIKTTALISLAEARSYVFGDVTDNTQDDKLADRINEFSDAVYRYTKREWKPVTSAATRSFWYPGYGMLSLAPYDLRVATAVVAFTDYPTAYQVTLTAGNSTVLGDYRLPADPLTNTIRWVDFGDDHIYYPYPSVPWMIEWYPSTHGRPPKRVGFTVTGDWGIGTVPDDVKLAVKIAVKNSVVNPEGGVSRTFGDLTITEPSELAPVDLAWRALPPESRALLTPYRDTAPVVVA